MIYRPMGSTGLKVSALSMGGGSLPDDPEKCDELLRACVAAGINYYETATIYCGGECQQRMGRGLEPVRDGVMISAKAGVQLEGEKDGCKETTGDDFRREIIDTQLLALQTDHVEWCQVGWLSANKIDMLRKKGGVMDAIRAMQDEGIVGRVGFTSHDSPENVVKIIESGLFESCTLQYNLLNQSYAPALDAAREAGVAVVVMGPLHGGMLASPKLSFRDLVPNAIQTSRAALHYVLDNPAVSTACSGMGSLTDLEENLASIKAEADAALWDEARQICERFKEHRKTMCTGCDYCRPCPEGVDISRNLRIRNYLAVYEEGDAARRAYGEIDAEQRAEQCTRCGQCEEKCPNDLPVRDLLAEVARRCG
jgi:hypothetical protein